MKKGIILAIIIVAIAIIVVLLEGNKEPAVVTTPSGEQVQLGVDDNPTGVVEVGIKVGNQAPNFTLETFDGELVELASIGKPVVIDFWAGWCPFCVEELPELEAAHQEFGDRVEFLGIHRTETESVATGLEFAEDKGVTYTLLQDPSGQVYREYKGGGSPMPIAFFIDENGIIKERRLGPKTEEQLRDGISKLLN
jgi:peroxiredoxin